ncbi:MAG TPA: peptide-methionine (S)-S-oxide reductase MsrA [Candidatus Paceibacterota bacterium]|jgi:methionine-S-sulfoxide reductase|nr:peptide-methionine (S)-S-oxide reductase MsrA [Candidatus Paceibacterota bacterium]
MNKVIFAGGCFWCVEHDLREANGVINVVSGYTGGDESTATYEQVSSHATKHREAVEVEYDSLKTSFKKLTQFFLDHIDPTDNGGQFGDRGENYQTVIYYSSDAEKEIAEDLLKELDESHMYDKPHVVKVEKVMPFYKAEEYHQRYAEKNPEKYEAYHKGSGREYFVNRTCAIREEKHIMWKE